MRIGFFWTPNFAANVLRDLVSEWDMEVVFVVTNPDKPVGRNQELKSSPVKEAAKLYTIPVLQPQKIRGNNEFLDILRWYMCDYFVVVAYGKILPVELLEIPKMCINVHGSILPKYRGASPIQAVLLNGESETGVTIMQMSEGMDEGDILMIERIYIDSRETSDTLFQKFEAISGKALIQTLRWIGAGQVHPVAQNHREATYCTKIEKEHGLVNWSLSVSHIYHMWQAYTPWPGIFTYYEGKRLLLEKVSADCLCEERSNPEKSRELPHGSWIASQARNDGEMRGTVVKLPDGGVWVICGDWVLTLEQVKLEWKKSQNIRDFVNGNQKFIWITL